MKNDFICVNNVKLPIRLYHEKRKNARVSIGKRAVYIRVPKYMPEHEKEKQIASLLQWAQKALLKHQDRFSAKPKRTYKDRDQLIVGNEVYELRIIYKDKKTSSGRITDNRIALSVSSSLSDAEKQTHISTLLSRCIGKQRLPGLRERISDLNKKHFRVKVGKIFFKYNKSNWGSCSSKRNINISTRLLFAPDDVLEYVCIHELAHLIERNHSKRFWALVEKAVPDYREKKKWLKDNRDKCWF